METQISIWGLLLCLGYKAKKLQNSLSQKSNTAVPGAVLVPSIPQSKEYITRTKQQTHCMHKRLKASERVRKHHYIISGCSIISKHVKSNLIESTQKDKPTESMKQQPIY
jgi:hypothetical protein